MIEQTAYGDTKNIGSKLQLILGASFLMLSALPVFSSSAQAADSPWSAGPVAIVQASPYVGGENGPRIFPALSYQGEKLVVRGPFIEYYLNGNARADSSIAITLGLGSNQLGVDGDSRLSGIDDRDSGFLAGIRYTHRLLGGNASIEVQTDITNKSSGQRATLGWDKRLAMGERGKWIIVGGIQLEYINEDYANYYFGVSETESLSSVFDSYSVGTSVQPSITLGGFYNFTNHWQLIYGLEWQFLSSDVKDSPIVDQNGVASGLVGAVYRF